MTNKKEKILEKDSKIYRIIQIEDMIYRFLSNRGKFNLNLKFKDKEQEKIFSDICKNICLRLNAFEPREEKDVVPPVIANAAIEIEKLIPEEEKISEKRFIITFIQWAKKDLFKKRYLKPVPWEIIDKVNKAREFETGTKNLKTTYDILDEYQSDLKEIIESGRSISSIARELGMSLPQLQVYVTTRSPEWNIEQTYHKIKIDNIEEAKEYIMNNSMKAMAERLGCSASWLSTYMKKNYPEIAEEIKKHRSKRKKKN